MNGLDEAFEMIGGILGAVTLLLLLLTRMETTLTSKVQPTRPRGGQPRATPARQPDDAN